MAKKVIAATLELDPQPAVQSVKSFKQQLREANNELLKVQQRFGETSDEAVKAAQSVAELNDRMGDAKQIVEAFNPDAKFQAFTSVLRTAAGGFAALTGAMALVGGESENLQKSLLKVQAALALSEGLSAIGTIGKSLAVMKVAAIDAFKAIKAGIGSTGIGLLVIAVGAIYEYWDDIRDAVTGVNSEQSKSLDMATKGVAAEKEKLSHLDDQDNILRLQGKSEKEILEFKKKQVQEAIVASEVQLQAQKDIEKHQIETAQRNHEILAGILNFTLIPIKAITSIIDSVLQKVGINSQLTKGLDKGVTSLTNLVFDPAETKAKADATNKETQDGITKLKNQYAGYQLQVNQINKEAAEKEKAFQAELRGIRTAAGNALITDAEILAVRRLKQDYENSKKSIQQSAYSQTQKNKLLKELDEKYLNESNAQFNASIKKLDDTLATSRTEQADKIKKEQDDRLNNFQKSGTANIQSILALNRELADLQLDEAGQRAAAETEQLNTWYAQKLEMAKGNEQAIFNLTKEYESRKTDITRMETESRLAVTEALLGRAADIFGKNTIAYKVLAIAQATINTYLGVSDALAAKTFTIFDTVAKFVNAGVILGAGLANVKRMVSVQVPGGGGSGSGAPSIGGLAPPPLSPRPQVGNTQLPQDQINQLGNAAQPVRAFVLESDVSSSQQRISRLNRAARLGS